MIKLSKKQLEIVEILKTGAHITYMKGLNCSVHIVSKDQLISNCLISISTYFALKEKGVLIEKNSDWRASDYFLNPEFLNKI